MHTDDDSINDLMQTTLDLSWCACDLDGHIAYFTTGGVGKMPLSVLGSNSGRKLVLEYFEAIPTKARFVRRQEIRQFKEISAKHYFRHFGVMGGRGLYAYDAQFHHHPTEPYVPYLLVVEPVSPTPLESLPKDVREVLASTRLPLRFKETSIIPYQLID